MKAHQSQLTNHTKAALRSLFTGLLLFANAGVGSASDDQLIINQHSAVIKAFSGDIESGSKCVGMIEVNNVILANIYTEQHGCELHKLDDQDGAQLFADINPGPLGYPNLINQSDRDGFGLHSTLAGWYYFMADDGINRFELWRTDGVVVEPVGSGDQWSDKNAEESSRGILNGRLYMVGALNPLMNPGVPGMFFFSTDGVSLRNEIHLHSSFLGPPDIAATVFDKLLTISIDEQHGIEPWVFDGSTSHMLGDLNEGPDYSVYWGTSFLKFNDIVLINAIRRDSLGNIIPGMTKTDGIGLTQTVHSGLWSTGNQSWRTFSTIRAADAVYRIRIVDGSLVTPPPEQQIRVLRATDVISEEYAAGDRFGMYDRPSVAVLGDELLMLMGNTLFLLGESSAEEIEFTIPSDWQNSDFQFVGSNLYLDRTYINETNEEDDSRVWVWNYEQAGLLMADDTHVVTSADQFRHIGNDIYFYGEDELNGRALRKISDTVIKAIPRLGAVTGSWYDPATSGQGFVLHPVTDDQTVFSFYGFEDDGKPLWLTGVSEDPLETGYSTEFVMFINSGGNFGSFSPDQISEEEWGTLQITFNTCSKATAKLDGASGQQSLNLVRLARLEGMECDQKIPPRPEAAGVTGSWFDPATSGQGLVLHPMNDGQMIVSFFGYKNNSERLWLIGIYNGQVKKGEPLVMDMVFSTGGSFGNFTAEDITETTWGTLTINFGDCNNATATLDGIDGQQTMNIVKLAGLQGSELDCH